MDPFAQRMLSKPVGVMWAGWRSDTLALQQAGWELAVEYEPMRDMYRLMIHSREGSLYGMSQATYLDRHLASMTQYQAAEAGCFYMTGLARSLEVITEHHMPEMPSAFVNFNQVDAQPQLTQRRIERIEDCNVFAVPLTRAEEVIIDKADLTVIEHLQAIKDLQDPKQQEIRNSILQEGERMDSSYASREVDVHANIVSLRVVS